MNPVRHLISELKTYGARVELVGEKVRLIYGQGKALPKPLIELARKLKTDLAAELRPENEHLRRRSSDEHVRSTKNGPQGAHHEKHEHLGESLSNIEGAQFDDVRLPRKVDGTILGSAGSSENSSKMLKTAEDAQHTHAGNTEHLRDLDSSTLSAETGTTDNLKAFFDKRVEILEFDCQMPRSLAESHAFEGGVVEWLDRNPVDSPPGRCLSCGDGDGLEGPPVLSYQQKGNEPAWFHQICWKTWHRGRRAEAAAALAAIGIPLPVQRLWRHENPSHSGG